MHSALQGPNVSRRAAARAEPHEPSAECRSAELHGPAAKGLRPLSDEPRAERHSAKPRGPAAECCGPRAEDVACTTCSQVMRCVYQPGRTVHVRLHLKSTYCHYCNQYTAAQCMCAQFSFCVAVAGANLGNLPSPAACATAAGEAGCTSFMHSASYPSWGCRCCSDPDGGSAHGSWDVYASPLKVHSHEC